MFFPGNNEPDNRLPPRLFATGKSPNGRLNIYSKPDHLAFIRHVLRDTEELQFIRDSCFGKLFDLPSRQCPVSCKLIHAMLTRQLVCDDKHTLWSVFGSDPIKFGLKEFGTITGLPCGAFPVGYTTEREDQSKAHKDPYWIQLIGKKKFPTIADLRHKLETDTTLSGGQKLRLALLIIVDGVLIAHQQSTRPTLKYVRMVEDVETFCLHPWGRESFLKTITCMKPPKFVPTKCEDPIGTLVTLLQQETYALKGFPLALQLLAYQAVPRLQSTIPIPVDNLTIMDLDVPHLPLYTAPSMLDITNVECHPNVSFSTTTFEHYALEIYKKVSKELTHFPAYYQLQVTSLIPIHSQPQPGWGVWPDVYNDDRLSYMEQLIVDKYEFKKEFWPGGHIPKLTAPHPTNKKQPLLPKAPLKRKLKSDPISEALKPRRTCKKSVTARKQRRISSYFGKPASSPNSNEKILEVLSAILVKVSNIEKNQKQLRKLVTSRKIKRHHKSSAFHILLDHTKKGNRSHRGCQTDQQQEDTPSHHKVCFFVLYFSFPIVSFHYISLYLNNLIVSTIHVVVSGAYGRRSTSGALSCRQPI